MIVLILGKDGQLGHQLVETLGCSAEVKAYGRDEIDVTNKRALVNLIEEVNPDVVVNAVAYTAVDQAETDIEAAYEVNSEAVKHLAKLTHSKDIYLIHYSTDYVFDGCKLGAYNEIDDTNPVNVYGESKLSGEKNILSTRGKHLIFRTTWVIGEHGNNFAKTILRLAQEKEELNVIRDQIGVPTSTRLIAAVTASAIEAIADEKPWPSGIYHLTPRGWTSWYGVANLLLSIAEDQGVELSVDARKLGSITSLEYPTAARRPTNSVLKTDKLQKVLPLKLPSWETDFTETVKNIIKETYKHGS